MKIPKSQMNSTKNNETKNQITQKFEVVLIVSSDSHIVYDFFIIKLNKIHVKLI